MHGGREIPDNLRQPTTPGVLRVSLPEDGGENVIPPVHRDEAPEVGQVFICAGAQLALPGTVVDVFSAASGLTGSPTCGQQE